MRLNHFIRLLTLLAFALFGGALPVAASGDHVVICGADGVKRIVSFDFETGKPVEVELIAPECQDCFGFAPLLTAPSGPAPVITTGAASHVTITAITLSRRPTGRPTTRAPPSLIT